MSPSPNLGKKSLFCAEDRFPRRLRPARKPPPAGPRAQPTMTSPSYSNAPVRIKVCGIREPAEAAALDAMGVEWIGFNFHPASARYIDPSAAAPIIRSLRRSVPVGVFVDATPARVAEVAALTGIRMAQLHGSETWETIQAMPLPVIKAIPHTRLADLGGLRAAIESAGPSGLGPLQYLLIDTQAKPAGAPGPIRPAEGKPAPGALPSAAEPAMAGFGGSGEAFDWSLLKAHPLPLPILLAGGLGPHNLAVARDMAAPFAVDLNSKVEIAPGRKDLGKIEACFGILGRIPG